ncbi:hypothetical protein ACRARG_02730 [Pseudooceanicola sp. C21-150M6]|uniref:hypothetical protein n=1 Tax=Pseudooceanicola sp. C21-150M6 TaxID=3434355 RepID=UPI003D7F4FCD
MKLTMRVLPVVLSTMLAAGAVSADEYSDVLENYAKNHVMPWANDPVLITAIRMQNQRTGGFSQSKIEDLDITWRREVGQPQMPMIDAVLNNPASDFLRQKVENAGGLISEVFVMDARGLNVAASDVTSDYWQGDEAKFQESFGQGAGAFHLGDIDFDESTQTYQAQVSLTILDDLTGQPIGAITVGVNAERLF